MVSPSHTPILYFFENMDPSSTSCNTFNVMSTLA